MNIRSMIIAGSVFLLFIITCLSTCTRVNPTEAGFRIENAGDYRGIDSLPLLTGYQFAFPGISQIKTIPTTMQHVAWTEGNTEGSRNDEAITISCAGGAGFKVDVGLNYHVDASKASHIYLRWKETDLDDITAKYIRNVVRGSMQDVSGYMTVDSVLNNLPGFEHQAGENIRIRMAKDGFLVDNFSILAQPRPTDKDLAISINAKIKARQDAERTKMEEQTSIAEANKAIATARGDSASKVIKALGEAEAVRVIQNVLSPTYVEYIKANQWDGKLSQIVTGSSGTFLNVSTK